MDILHKMKENLGQARVEKDFYSSSARLEQFLLISLKNDSFQILTLLFRMSLSKIWLSHLHKIYIFEMRNNRAIR